MNKIDKKVLQAKIAMWNRLWDKSVGKTSNVNKGMVLLLRELEKIRDEISVQLEELKKKK